MALFYSLENLDLANLQQHLQHHDTQPPPFLSSIHFDFPKQVPASLPKEYISVHPPDAPVINPVHAQPSGLDILKSTSGSSYYNPITHRQHVGAFSSDFNSSRFESISCPEIPDPSYPKTYPMKDVLDNWNPDDNTIPPFHYNSICYFNYVTEYQKALNYRQAEVPFVVYNVPEVQEVVEKWNSMEYLNKKVGPNKKYTTATSQDNHFMYYNRPDKRGIYKDQQGNPWTKPTGETQMTFSEWLNIAVDNHNKSLEERKHYYFRVSTDGPSHWVFDELKFFQPKKSLFIVSPSGQKGIHCRFGMNRYLFLSSISFSLSLSFFFFLSIALSVISENHYDGSRNYAATIGGMRRWILNHPNQCKNLYMFPEGHPSERHSSIDWSKPNYEQFPLFKNAETNELIVRPGDVLYLPTNWYHYIISLNINFQCNTRSGRTSEYDKMVEEECGF